MAAAAVVADEAATNGAMEAAAVEVEEAAAATVEIGAGTDMTIIAIGAMMIDVVAAVIMATRTMAEINVAAAVAAATNMDRNGTKTAIQAAEVYAKNIYSLLKKMSFFIHFTYTISFVHLQSYSSKSSSSHWNSSKGYDRPQTMSSNSRSYGSSFGSMVSYHHHYYT